MSTYSKDKTIMKTIRINQTENDNWDINKIHDFLLGIVDSNDSIEINKLKRDFKRLYQIMNLYMKPKSNLTDEIINELVKMEEEHNLE